MTDQPTAILARVDVDVPCVGCGYNIRTLVLDAVCPECGVSVDQSLRHGWLPLADPAWLRRVRSGVTLVLWGLLAAVVAYFGLVMALLISSNFGASEPDPVVLVVLVFVLGAGFFTGWMVSVLRMTAPEPRGPMLPARRGTLARVIVVLSAAYAAPVLAVIGLMAAVVDGDPRPNLGYILAIILAYAGGLAGQVGFFLLMIYMRRIARRDVTTGLGTLMTIQIWGYVAMVGTWIAFGLAMALFTISTARTVMATTTSAAVAPPFGTTLPATSAPTTFPAGPPIPPFMLGRGFIVILAASAVTQFLGLAWLVLGVVGLFWFRRALARAIGGRLETDTATYA